VKTEPYTDDQGCTFRDNFRQDKMTESHRRHNYDIYKQMKPFIGNILSKKFVMSKISPLTEDDILLLEAEESHENDENEGDDSKGMNRQ